MEAAVDAQCSVVYFCGGAQQQQQQQEIEDEVCQLFHRGSLLDDASPPAARHSALDRVYANVRALLDEDQGGFHEVFVSSHADTCRDRIESYASSVPTVVLVELDDAKRESSSAQSGEDHPASSLQFLRTLAADVCGARYQRHVMPFVLVRATAPPEPESVVDAEVTASCLDAGALDIIHSPIGPDDIPHLVGHVRERLRPSARLIGASMPENLVTSIRKTSPIQVAAHRPDLVIPAPRLQAVEESVGCWSFPAHEFNMDELTYAVLVMVEHILQMPELSSHTLPRADLMTFLLATRRQYKHHREVHYHNWRHAVDVTQCIYCFLLDIGLCPPPASSGRPKSPLSPNALEKLLTPLDGLILLVSAIGHDVGHPGVNNAFLVACDHPLAQIYNDKSVLENYHCAAYAQLLRRHWPTLSRVSALRPALISNILATDMQRHFEYMSELGKLKQQVETSEPDLSNWSDKDRDHARGLITALLMKAADISNVARPFDVSEIWARILINEFSRQGELESELGIPTCLFGGPPNKEDMLAAAQSQKGFIDLFGLPLFSGMCDVMPSASCAMVELENNQVTWEQRIGQEKARRESGGETAPVTFSAVTESEVNEAQGQRHSNSEPTAVPDTTPQTPSSPVARQPVVGAETAPEMHPAQPLRQLTSVGIPSTGDKRASAPYSHSPTNPSSPRRSSKDVALDHLQHFSALAQQGISPSSRRGSVDTSWQLQQSYPGSRRGSKDESLTTILVTSQGSPRKNSPSSLGKSTKANGSPGRNSTNGKRHSLTLSQKQTPLRNPVSSARSHTTSSATTATMQQSPSVSTQPSSITPTDEETPPASMDQPDKSASDESYVLSDHWSSDRGDTAGQPCCDPESMSKTARGHTPRIITRMAGGGGSDDGTGHDVRRKTERELRQARSRSRLRGLKFWKRKKDVPGTETGESESF